MPKLSGRVYLIDELRGLSILLMVIYHGAYDLVSIFRLDIPLFYSPVIQFLQVFFAGVFVFISGVSCRFSHNNLKRGFVVLMIGMAMSAFTIFFMPEQTILFGILHMLGSCMILFGLLRKPLDRMPPFLGFVLFLLLFVFTYGVASGYVGIPSVWELALPDVLYQSPYLFPLGLPHVGFFSSDYFPLIPWVFLFLAGSFFGIPVQNRRLPDFVYRSHSRFLALCGRYTLYIYILHQPIVYGLLSFAFFVWGKF